jgi:2,6-dihydroxypyridine 3-monooxygenase
VQVPGGPRLPITRCAGRRTLEPDGSASPLQAMPQTFTSWQAVHTMLMRQFPADRYHAGAVVGEAARRGSGLEIPIAGFGTVAADVLIAADGSRSAIRHRMLPELEASYAGYVAWRGTIREADMPRDLVAVFDDVFTFADARSGGHALAYFIPGDDLGTGPGERRMNWVWYVGANPQERDALLVDRDGQQRAASLQRGMTRDDVVAALPDFAARELHPSRRSSIWVCRKACSAAPR